MRVYVSTLIMQSHARLIQQYPFHNCTNTTDCYNKGVDAGKTAHGNPCPIISENLTLDAAFCSGYAFGDSVGD
jgi:hypothetical protein